MAESDYESFPITKCPPGVARGVEPESEGRPVGRARVGRLPGLHTIEQRIDYEAKWFYRRRRKTRKDVPQ